MKKIIFTLLMIFLLAPNFMQAQPIEAGDISSIKSYPVIYAYNEQVTWTFDLSATTFSPGEDLYIWIWSPSEPDAGNWTNSSDFAKLKYEGDMRWSFTLTPTLYFSKTPAEIAASAGFWFRLKDKTGTKQSGVGNVAYTDFSAFYTANQMIKSYPEKPLVDQGVSILFNSNLVPGFVGVPSVHFHSGINNWNVLQEYQAWLPDISAKTQLKDLGNGFYKMDLIPSQYYGTPAGYVMENIVFLMVAKDWAATSPDQIIYAGEFVPPPPPEFSYFPLQISQKDFLGLIRKNNERGINKLTYTVTAGTKVITGVFSGNTAEIKGFINLVSELNGIPNLKEIHVVVKDNTNRTISDTVITLKVLD
ncbi:hypothetical protein [Flavobacterium franklandianum]|uniref:Uncharacterized protein n=1 Tax=Flavobacterium franklandianum TaxID=2594430 RepID=A0A553CMJ3_9FLAO|nr:hypothetical protein [Flavobacterium franklandianum]TRX21657.1 hypothetical protein FNW17_07180 [Flavobacterium franklandianum]